MRAILTYHSIDGSGSPVSCAPETFDSHVRWLASGRVRVTTIEELLSLPPSVDAVAITFDDGFVSVAEVAAPRLISHGLAATVFVVTEHAGLTNAWGGVPDPSIPHLPLMNWDALGRLQEQGWHLGSHSRTHPDLTRVSDGRLSEEVHGACEDIRRACGVSPTVFAYPYGYVDRRVAHVVGSAHDYACTTRFLPIDVGMDRAWLPRLDAFYYSRPGLLDGWGTPSFERSVARRHALRWLRRAPAALGRRMLSLRRL